MKFGNIDLEKLGEIQNAKLHNLPSTPTGVVESQIWYDTSNHEPMYYDGTSAKQFGIVYSQGTGISISNNTISVASTVLMNTATGLGSLSILGSTSSYNEAIAIGADSSVTGNYGVAIGKYAKSTNYSIALGEYAQSTAEEAYQIGHGTNSTAYSLCVGFYNSGQSQAIGNYQLLDGTTGLIPSARLPIATSSALGGVIVGTNISVGNDGTISVASASTSAKGLIEIATDTEVSTGTDTSRAVTPKQLAGKVNKLSTSATAGTYTKVTITADGLVSSGSTLLASDIPSLTLSKISDITATASELNILDGITASTTELNYVDGVTSAIQTQLDNKLAVKPDGTNNLIDGGNKINLEYIPDVILGQVLYGGTFVPSTAVATLSTNAKTKLGTTNNTIGLTNDTTAITGYIANEGLYYICSGDGTFASISFLTGDWLISTGSGWKKIDNTDAVTGVKGNAESSYRTGNINITADNVLPTQTSNSGKYLTTNGTTASWGDVPSTLPSQSGNSGKFLTTNGTTASWANAVTPTGTQTLTNKTIDADDNTISDLTASNLKSGVLLTSVRSVASASDTSWVSEKAVASAFANTVYSEQNSALTVSSGGICSWTVTHNLGTENVGVYVYEVSSGERVMYDYAITSSNVVTVKILASANISANTYKVVVKA